MDPAAIALIGLVAVGTAALILAERERGSRAVWIAKPVASLGFVALGFSRGAPADPFLAGALVVSFLGDLLLIPKDPRVFRVGILVFLLAHVAFMGAFALRGLDGAWAGAALLPLTIVLIIVARWLLPKVPRGFTPAVLAYMLVITAMVALAAGTRLWTLIVPAFAFYLNDLLVARDRFVRQAWWHRVAGLPLYYGAMVVFALAASGRL